MELAETARMNGLPAPPPAVQVDYWLAKKIITDMNSARRLF